VDQAVDDLLELFLELVRIPSPSGSERGVADLVKRRLQSAGLDPLEDDTAAATGAGSGNIVVRLPGEGRGTPIVVAAHMDTVAVEGPIEPIVVDGAVRTAGDTILGGDDKAAVAVLLASLCELAASPPACGVEGVFSTCEEVGLRGAKAMDLTGLQARAGFVLDSTGPVGDVIVRAPSQKMVKAEFHGTAAHAGIAPEQGRSAILAAGRALAAMRLGRLDEVTTANVGLIEGGSATNIVPERCRLEAEARSHDPQKLAAQVGDMLEAINVAATETGVDVQVTVTDEFTAFALDDDALPVRIAVRALERAGFTPRLIGSGGGSDVNVYNAAGLPSVNLSVGMENVHTSDEYLPVARLHEAASLLRAIIEAAAATRPD
jgi:tripeptide aminopeptidase